MFKYLKITKVIVFVGLLVVIFFKINFSDFLMTECYTHKPSYYSKEEVEIYYSSQKKFPFNVSIPVVDVNNKEAFPVNLPFLQNTIKNDKVLSKGLQFTNSYSFSIPQNLKSGIYFINGKYPFIVKQKPIHKITVVYPFMNNLIYQPYQNKNVFNANVPITSFFRTTYEDDYTKGLKNLFTEINANFITDVDLEDNTNFANQQLIIIYGKATYFTPKMKQNIDKYVKNGGNLLIISSYFQNNICWYNSSTSEVTLIHPKSEAIQCWQTYLKQQNDSITSLTPLDYVYGGFSANENNLKIISPQHPLLKGVKNLKVNTALNMSLPNYWEHQHPVIDTSKVKIYHAEILAYEKASYNNNNGIRGIFEFQPTKTSGKIISLVSEDWCLEKNYGENKDIRLVTQNAINYLSK